MRTLEVFGHDIDPGLIVAVGPVEHVDDINLGKRCYSFNVHLLGGHTLAITGVPIRPGAVLPNDEADREADRRREANTARNEVVNAWRNIK